MLNNVQQFIEEDRERRSMIVYYLTNTKFNDDYSLPYYANSVGKFDLYLEDNGATPSKEFSWETGIKLLLCCNSVDLRPVTVIGRDYVRISFSLSDQSPNAHQHSRRTISFCFEKSQVKCTATLTGLPYQPDGTVKTDVTSFSILKDRKELQLSKFSLRFVGTPLFHSLQVIPHYHFPEIIKSSISFLFTYSTTLKSFKYIPQTIITNLLFSFSYIDTINELKNQLILNDPFQFFQNNGGLLYFSDQKENEGVFNFSIAKYLYIRNSKEIAKIFNLETQEVTEMQIGSNDHSSHPDFLKNPLSVMVYIYPQFASILKNAIQIKEYLNHQFIHMQLDASFKAVRPFVYSVPRIEMFWATVPIGFILAPTESHEMYSFFIKCLKHAISEYNKGQPEKNQIRIDFSKDVFYLSDTGTANLSFYSELGTDHYAYCTHHTLNINGAFSPLCKLAIEILSTHSKQEWIDHRSEYFQMLKSLYMSTLVSPSKNYCKKIDNFSKDLGLSNNLLTDTEPLPFNERETELLHKLPIDRDYSSDTTNGPEGGHAQYNKISMNNSLPHRSVFIISKGIDEIDQKQLDGPFLARLHNMVVHSPKESKQNSCDCKVALYNYNVFKIYLCQHTAQSVLRQSRDKKLIPRIIFSKDFQWNKDTQYIYYYQGIREHWPISKTMLRLYVLHQKIKNHQFNVMPEEQAFYNCLKRLVYYNIKIMEENNLTYEDNCKIINNNVSLILSQYFHQVSLPNNKIVMIPIHRDFYLKYTHYYQLMKSSLITLHQTMYQVPSVIKKKVEAFLSGSLDAKVQMKLRRKSQNITHMISAFTPH